MFSMVLESRTMYNDASEHFSLFLLFVVIFQSFFFHRRSSELQRAGSGLLDKVITDTRSLKQIPLTEFSSDKDSSTCSFKCREAP